MYELPIRYTVLKINNMTAVKQQIDCFSNEVKTRSKLIQCKQNNKPQGHKGHSYRMYWI